MPTSDDRSKRWMKFDVCDDVRMWQTWYLRHGYNPERFSGDALKISEVMTWSDDVRCSLVYLNLTTPCGPGREILG